LMAADILLYDCDYVPVGLDQQQHIELTRDIALRFNHKFGEIFYPPKEWSKQVEYLNRTKGLKILSLSDPSKKMSKSDYDSKGCIFMTDKPEDVIKKIMSASTDSLASIDYDPINQAGISNLLTILACVRSVPVEEVTAEFKGESRYGDFKKIVAQELSEFINQFQIKFNQITNAELEVILLTNEQKVKSIASQKLTKVYQVLGL
jgi:tryptophanyl-tRNA synthetase